MCDVEVFASDRFPLTRVIAALPAVARNDAREERTGSHRGLSTYTG